MRLITEAGKRLLGLTKTMGKGVGKNFMKAGKEMGPGQLAAAIAPDLMFGGIYGAMTPGDINDKLIAGAGSAIGGAAGGVGLRMGLGIKNPMLGLGVDYAGSIGGDMIGANVADRVLRAKHGGLTPMEQEQLKYQQQLEESIRAQVMQEMGINPQTRQPMGLY